MTFFKKFKLFNKLIILNIVLIELAKDCTSVSFHVTLYDHKNYKGPSRSLNVTRCQNVFDINFNDRTTSIVIPSCIKLYDHRCCQGRSKQIYTSLENLGSIGFDDQITSISPCGEFTEPAPHQIHETWSGHGQIMTKVAEGVDTVIYYNDDIQRTGLRSHSNYLRRLWSHVTESYGNFGPEKSRLFAFFHANVPTSLYRHNSIQSYFDSQSECRNLIDLVGTNEEAWSRSLDKNGADDLDSITHEVSHIIEWSSKGVHGSPTFQLWGDSAWAEIFTFDAYTSLGRHKDRERWYRKMIQSKHNFPRYNTHWFRDWFYPIYKSYGGVRVLSKYFSTLEEHFPRKENGWEYARNINLGEFVHFFSGAARTDLKPFAVKAFNWDINAERQYLDAKLNFSQIWY